jgi:hypothetical protein
MVGTPGVTSDARTPEELEALFEDALVQRDSVMLGALFEPGATLVTSNERQTRSPKAIACMALATWGDDHPYVADPRRVVVARDIALIIAEQGINVIHRDCDGAWRYSIVLQTAGDSNEQEANAHGYESHTTCARSY